MIEPATQVTHADIHAMEPRSRANGPGVRFVVWFQGCTLGCAGCFNPATHSGSLGASRRSLAELYAEIDLAMIGAPIEGLTLSGGEPMQQIQAGVFGLHKAGDFCVAWWQPCVGTG
jgi:anaerobic ribonucleoside-triphosphate reductase activating protein